MSKRHNLTEELKKLEAELDSLGTAVAESQVWYKKARIDEIKKELAELDKPKNQFNNASAELEERMTKMQQERASAPMAAGYDGGRS